jgi:signal transduction histidine kinase
MKIILAIILFFYLPVQLRAQIQVDSMSPGYNPFLADSLRSKIDRADNDSAKAWNMILLYWAIEGIESDSALVIAKQAYKFSKSKQFKFMEVYALMAIGYNHRNTGDYAESLKTYLQVFEILGYSSFHESNSLPDSDGSVLDRETLHEYAETQRHMGFLLGNVGNRTEELNKYRTALKIHEALKDERLVANTTNNIAEVYLATNLPDSAILFAKKSLGHYEKQNVPFYVKTYLGHIYNIIGEANLLLKKYDLAEDALLKAEKANIQYKNLRILIQTYLLRAEIFNQKQEYDSSLNYAHKARVTAIEVGLKSYIAKSYAALAKSYQALNKQDSGYHYLKLAAPLIDSLNKVEKNNLVRYQNILFTENQDLQRIEKEKTAKQNRIRIITLLGTLGFILLIALLLYHNNRQKQKTNKVLEATLTNLKSTQSQLIQSEKMASLGELTAGIAHEIQNPLNFVNNFSEVNKELIEELKGIRHKAEGERDPQLEEELLDDIAQNEDKINHHGKRADAIVKGMLQHSSSGSGKKEPTDINALADEYLRLAYHGLRAKDKSFNATMKTDFDKSIGSINIIPQDMGRVILNLINNAFFAVSERKTLLQAKGDSYEPTVVIATASIQPLQSLSKDGGRSIQIKVSDNGGGIPQKILDKIFQPFFTTKPTGQGTGLGLSLSYDIVKAHGGEIRVETKEGEGTVFLIQLPG